MDRVTISPKFQIVLPKRARELLGLKVGEKMLVIAYNQRIVLVPERPIQEARGSLRGMDTTIERDDAERL